jgi:hypothetical protein
VTMPMKPQDVFRKYLEPDLLDWYDGMVADARRWQDQQAARDHDLAVRRQLADALELALKDDIAVNGPAAGDDLVMVSVASLRDTIAFLRGETTP